jgi:hypothetical protein
MNNRLIHLFGALLLVCLTGSCDFPYAPQRQPQPSSSTTSKDTSGAVTIAGGSIYAVNKGQQACNPSVSQNPLFPACMAWLNLNRMAVIVPESLAAFSPEGAVSHDRITIVDTGNVVRWFIMRSAVDSRGELQCPEWSTHPDYLACLTGAPLNPYSGFAVRISDKKVLKICNRNLGEFSTPHFWLPDSAPGGGTAEAPSFDASGFVDKASVARFFGSTRFKMVYSLVPGDGTLYYVDYSADGDPVPIALAKPSGQPNDYCGSPLISPDGNWVAYHCYENSAQGNSYSSYIQRLRPGSTPILVAENASDPHWWVDPYSDAHEYYIVYSFTRGEYETDFDFSNPAVAAGGEAGSTVLVRLKGTWRDAPDFVGSLAVDGSYQPRVIARLPFKGGLSRDGRFLCTSYKYSYLLRMKESW